MCLSCFYDSDYDSVVADLEEFFLNDDGKYYSPSVKKNVLLGLLEGKTLQTLQQTQLMLCDSLVQKGALEVCDETLGKSPIYHLTKKGRNIVSMYLL